MSIEKHTNMRPTPLIAIRLAAAGLLSCVVIALCWPLLQLGATPQPDEASEVTPVASKAAAKGELPETISFNEHIRPILSDKCYFCHGFDKNTREADLRLDTFEGATEDFGGYAAVVPGSRKKSELWLRINDKTDPMPPKKSHKELSKQEIELIGKWIDSGAAYEDHWAYTPIERPKVPSVKDRAWSSNPLDQFVLSKLEKHKIKPSPQADKRTLMRRVTFDLTGLPPTPEQVEKFMGNDSPGAYEAYVDSLLASPSYGEHMAVWWLDLVRYADTKGLHGDQERPSWAYRDWVIKSLNDNMPFDRFTIMQIAGDLMQDEPTRDMLVASAYNRLSPQTEEGGAQHKEYEAIYNADRVGNYSDVWLGSSVACAQCHDHKFDPFLMEDFYKMAAFFADINQQIIGHRSGYALNAPPFTFVPQDEEQAKKIAEHEKNYHAFIEKHPYAMVIEERLTSRDYIPPTPEADPEAKAYEEELKKLLKERAELAKQVPVVTTTRALETPRTVRILDRGNWQDETGKVVLPATPAFLGGPKSTEGRRLTRLDLAQWTVAPDNPLTARAITNRLWARFLGNPLSSNTIDLGSQGTVPTHPGLMDWLSREFVDSGWDLKRVVRLIVTSETYKQSSDKRDDLASIDPDNKVYFARQSAVRLPAEVIRNQVLAVSGLLTDKIGGPSVFPYQPDGHWEPLNFPRRPYKTSTGEDLYRRGVYTWMQRTFPHPMMTSFDAPSRESCTGQRMVSATPLQALGLLNGPTFVESARVLAERLVNQYETDEARLQALFKTVLARTPRETEQQAMMKLVASQRKHFGDKPEDAAKLAAAGTAPPTFADLDPIEVATWTSACRVVLNLHETITRN